MERPPPERPIAAPLRVRLDGAPPASGALAALHNLLGGNPALSRIDFTNAEGLFAHPELAAVLEAAQQRGIRLTADAGARLDAVPGENLEALVRFRFRRIACSIPAAAAETYSLHHPGGDFHALMTNLRRLDELKQAHRSSFPRLTWEFPATSASRPEIKPARVVARDLGMRFRLRWPAEDHLAGCGQLWRGPRLDWEGRVWGCRHNSWEAFEACAFDVPLAVLLNGPRMRQARAMLTGSEPGAHPVPCSTCDVYLEMRGSGLFLPEPRVDFPWGPLGGFAEALSIRWEKLRRWARI